MTCLQMLSRTIRLIPPLLAGVLLTGCVVVPPHHHHPGHRPVYVEPGPRHCHC